jgi:hypothetical protein
VCRGGNPAIHNATPIKEPKMNANCIQKAMEKLMNAMEKNTNANRAIRLFFTANVIMKDGFYRILLGYGLNEAEANAAMKVPFLDICAESGGIFYAYNRHGLANYFVSNEADIESLCETITYRGLR